MAPPPRRDPVLDRRRGVRARLGRARARPARRRRTPHAHSVVERARCGPVRASRSCCSAEDGTTAGRRAEPGGLSPWPARKPARSRVPARARGAAAQARRSARARAAPASTRRDGAAAAPSSRSTCLRARRRPAAHRLAGVRAHGRDRWSSFSAPRRTSWCGLVSTPRRRSATAIPQKFDVARRLAAAFGYIALAARAARRSRDRRERTRRNSSSALGRIGALGAAASGLAALLARRSAVPPLRDAPTSARASIRIVQRSRRAGRARRGAATSSTPDR